MGWSLSKESNFEFRQERALVSADGNNLSWSCPCGGPVLFVYQRGRRGSCQSSPTQCPKCNAQYFLDPQFDTISEPRPGTSMAPAILMKIIQTP
jgi:hypothetical protein